MKLLFMVVSLSCGCALHLIAGDLPSAHANLATLSWLAGSWNSDVNGRQITEQWMGPAGGTMLGMSRTVVGGNTVEYEFLVLREEKNGDVNYVAKPSGQPEASFKLIRASTSEAVFENLEHDFPQRIIYALKNDGKLTAAIEGSKNGKTRRIEFTYQRVKS